MPAKKTTKKAPAKKRAVKKAPAKKAAKKATKKAAKKAAKKLAVKKLSKTRIVAQVDVGFGNTLYIRGEGAGLSWDKGQAMNNISPYEWAFEAKQKDGDINYKLLINDDAWADGDNMTAKAGTRTLVSPVFFW